MSFEEDGINLLGEIRWCGPRRVGQFGEVKMGELGSNLVVMKTFYGIWGLVLWLRVEDGNSRLSHDPMPLDILYLSTCAPVVHRSVLQCCSGSVQVCYPPFLDPY